MMQNILINDVKKLDEGYLMTCDVVMKTLSLEGRLVLMENLNHNLPPILTKDGFNTSQMVRFKDKFQNFGALQAIQATTRTLAEAGDNTTSTLCFAQGFLRKIKRRDFNKSVERGIDIGVKEVVEAMHSHSTPINREILERISITSSNGDVDLGKKVLEAYDLVGYESNVTVKSNSSSLDIEVISQKGMKFNKGYSSPYFINNNKNATFEAENVLVVSLETWQSDEKIMNFIKANRLTDDGNLQPILFFMEKENGDFRESLINLINAGHLNACLVIAPDGHSEYRCTTNIKDLALFTDGISYNPAHSEIKAGIADSVLVNSENTFVVRDTISQEVSDKIKELKDTVDADGFIKERIQRLEGKSCVISVGGYSENDINEKLDRLDDALKAVKSAIPEGVIPGGGSSLVYISHRMNRSFSNISVQRGYELVKRVILETSLQVLKNSKRKNVESWLGTLLGGKRYLKQSRKTFGVGYNAQKDEVTDLFEDGVIDSVKAMRVALETAKESAVKMLLTEVVITVPEN